ncbi:hypothetical protein HYW74_01505 [Candidatus Pacearchaeota archaeon]|nr:hypothetical protein [Candidatus Pacearchaeota archaeon]
MVKKLLPFLVLPFFFLFILFFSFQSVYAQPSSTCPNQGQCYVNSLNICIDEGDVFNNSQYCLNGTLLNQRQRGSNCLNDYECLNSLCVEGVCKLRYTSLNQTLLQQILNLLTGGASGCAASSDCPSGQFCNANNQCQANPSQPPPGGGGGGGGGRCDSTWSCTTWSNKTYSCGTRTCRDIICNRDSGKPEEIRACPIVITTPPTPVVEAPYCGDNVCNTDNGESCDTCSYDCSGMCPVAEPQKLNRTWLIILIVIIILIIISIIAIIVVLYRKRNSGKTSNLKTLQKPAPGSGSGTAINSQSTQNKGTEDKSFRNLDFSRR